MPRPIEMPVCGGSTEMPDTLDALRHLKDIGVTSIQLYVRWRAIESKKEGEWDWSFYDAEVEKFAKAGLKWIPFLLMGPKYAAPDWWLSDKRHVGLVCLEHGKTSKIESIWNPLFRERITSFLSVFAEHYGSWNILESVQPGICGDYGEAIFPVLGNWPGDYHTHTGYWCGGVDAQADFARYLEKRYGTIDALAKSWRILDGARPKSFAECKPFLRHRAPSNSAWLEQIRWYRDSMTRYAEFWMSECARLFPGIPAYLCTGGDEHPAHGSSFTAQSKIAARYNGGIRITNEANKFHRNFFWTSLTWAACRYYGAKLGLEPVGPITPRGIRERVFGAIAFGAQQLFHYLGNIVVPKTHHTDPDVVHSLALYKEHGASSIDSHAEGKPEADGIEEGLAMYWPTARAIVEGAMPETMAEYLEALRRRVTVTPLGDELIADGALNRFPALVIMDAAMAPKETLLEIAKWTQNGGKTLLCIGDMHDVELEPCEEFNALFGITPTSSNEWGHTAHWFGGDEPEISGADLSHWPELNDIERYHCDHGWMDLSSKAKIIFGSRPLKTPRNDLQMGDGFLGRPVASCFSSELPQGGIAIRYEGPRAMTDDPQALFRTALVLPKILDTVCRRSGIPLRIANASKGEVARAFTNGSEWLLTEEAIEKR